MRLHAGAANGTNGAARLGEAEEEAGASADEDEPDKDSRGLSLTAVTHFVVKENVLVVPGRIAASAVDGAEQRSKDNAVNNGEEDEGGVEREKNDGSPERRDKGRGNAVEGDDPRQDGDEHGEVDGGLVVADGDQVADKSRQEQSPEERCGADNGVEEPRHDENVVGGKEL